VQSTRLMCESAFSTGYRRTASDDGHQIGDRHDDLRRKARSSAVDGLRAILTHLSASYIATVAIAITTPDLTIRQRESHGVRATSGGSLSDEALASTGLLGAGNVRTCDGDGVGPQ
jgi:hypothetical protein